jgi:hypothetical protein
MALWTKPEIDLLAKNLLVEPRKIYRKFTEDFGPTRSFESIKKKVNQLRKDTSRYANLDLNPLESLDPQIVREQLIVWLESLASLYKEKKPFFSFRKVRQSSKPSLFLLLSDTHCGKQTDDYNMQTFADRLASIPEKLAEEPHPVFDEIILGLVGDILEGEDIFPTQNGLIEAPVIIQAKLAIECIWNLALVLTERFQVPVRIVTNPGNHGRMSKTANPVSNWDNVVYEALALIAHHSQHESISVEVNLEEICVVNVKGKKLMLNHKGIKHAGTPGTQVKLAGWIISRDISALVQGHWHNHAIETFAGVPRICNGSLSGVDDLSTRMGREEGPKQAYFFVYSNKPINHFSFLTW